MHPIPSTVAEITTDWLDAALRETGILHGARITDVDSGVIGQEFGFTGVIARLHPTYDGDPGDAPRSLIAKLPIAERATPTNYSVRHGIDAAARRRLAQRAARELWFYQQVAPHGHVAAPKMYSGAADLDAGRVVLLLEDVTPAAQGDVLDGCSVEQVAAVVQEMARFHAYWWQHPALASFEWLPDWSGNMDARQARYNETAGRFLDRYSRQVPRRVRTLIDELRTRYARVLAALVTPPVTLVHGDLHLDNILFHPAGSARPVTVLDWQSVARGRAALDLSRFLVESLTSETRRACETDLLGQYHALLIQHGVGYSSDDLLRDYRLALLQQLGGVVGWLGAVDVEGLFGRERELVEAMISEGRLFAALLERDVERVLVG